jgi:hypothetical protein
MPRAGYHFCGNLAELTKLSRVLLLLVPLVGIAELALDLFFASRAPSLSEWVDAVPRLQAAHREGDLIVIAPEWAEPLARQAFGDGFMPLGNVARQDVAPYARVLEVSLFGRRAPELARFKELARESSGKLLIRTLENPAPEPTIYAFSDHVRPRDLFVVEGNGEAERACEFTPLAAASSGGLGGHNAYPRERFRCDGGEPYFVGVTLMEDQRYRPRRCVYAHPLPDRSLYLRFPRVPAGKKIKGYAGESFLIARDAPAEATVELAVLVDRKEVGRRVFRASAGFTPFEFSMASPSASETVEVSFRVLSQAPAEREFCFQAEVR